MDHRRTPRDGRNLIFRPSPVEVDETYRGGIDANKHANRKPVYGNTYGVQQHVVGMKSRETNQVKAQVIQIGPYAQAWVLWGVSQDEPETLTAVRQGIFGTHNIREQDTIDQMAFIAKNFAGKRLRYKQLTV